MPPIKMSYEEVKKEFELRNYILLDTEYKGTDNGIVMCQFCHVTFHGIFGRKYNNPDQFLQFKNNKLYLNKTKVS
jgi:hypothetical protein